MGDADEANEAIAGMNDYILNGTKLVVEMARKKFRGVDLDVGPPPQPAVVVLVLPVGGIGGIEVTKKNIEVIGIKKEGEEVGVVLQAPLQVEKEEEEKKKKKKREREKKKKKKKKS